MAIIKLVIDTWSERGVKGGTSYKKINMNLDREHMKI
jgi:hypothetical protein